MALSKKIYVFDLDSTLWDGKNAYPDVESILKKLRRDNNYIFLASFNPNAVKILNRLKLSRYFHGGVHGLGASKYNMIQEILKYLGKKADGLPIEFYDDLYLNILEVSIRGKNIKAIHIKNGLSWNDLIK